MSGIPQRPKTRSVAGDDRFPKTRAECVDAPRPCPWVRCKHHLYLDVNPKTGTIKLNFPDLEPWELEESCSLDVADRNATNEVRDKRDGVRAAMLHGDVGKSLGMKADAVRMAETRATERIKPAASVLEGRDDSSTETATIDGAAVRSEPDAP